MKHFAQALLHTTIVILFGVLLTTSCSDTKSLKNGDTIFFPDTAAFIRHWKMNETAMMSGLMIADSAYKELELDTFELTYGMCDCPDWHDYTKGDIDCRECTEFYVEPADAGLQFPSEFFVSGNTVRFYGKLIPGFNLPQNREFTTPNPEPWTVIRYYGYEVVRPYKVWGPKMKEFQEPADTLTYSVVVPIGK